MGTFSLSLHHNLITVKYPLLAWIFSLSPFLLFIVNTFSVKPYTYFKYIQRVFLNGPTPVSFSFIFIFSNTNDNFWQQLNVKNVHPVKWCRDSNSQPWEHESPPITTRPWLPPTSTYVYIILIWTDVVRHSTKGCVDLLLYLPGTVFPLSLLEVLNQSI